MTVQDKTVLVTGGTSGIGEATARAYAAAGANVVITGRDEERGRQIVESLVHGGARARFVRADLERLEDVQRLAEEVEHVDVLVNNAGVFPRAPFLEIRESDWDFVLGVNLKGTCFCAQAVAKRMVTAGRSGAIINLTSGAAYRGSPRGAHYCASKGGVVSLTRQMALELAPYHIRVNAIAPGLTDTAQPRYGSSEEEIAAAAQIIPLGRIAQPDDIARTAVFLASDEAGFTTGQILHVNGGGYLG